MRQTEKSVWQDEDKLETAKGGEEVVDEVKWDMFVTDQSIQPHQLIWPNKDFLWNNIEENIWEIKVVKHHHVII